MKPPPELYILRAEAGPLPAPPDRGRLLTAAQLAAQLFNGTVSPAWVRRHVPYKLALGHSTVRWYEVDVRTWLEERRASPPAP